ncbi:hypothetical protein Tco_1044742 [Tanacetum coccineum]|uniref:Uncharacterized protein n=1 Tax=Tanacetum coccineum TaxID=301880 RepID=A0ABQ5GQS2_9ASTR
MAPVVECLGAAPVSDASSWFDASSLLRCSFVKLLLDSFGKLSIRIINSGTDHLTDRQFEIDQLSELVSFMRILRLREVARATARIALEFAPEFVYVYCMDFVELDDIHDDTLVFPLGGFEISSWRGARVGVRRIIWVVPIDGRVANGNYRDLSMELESSRFTFDLVPLSYESVDVQRRKRTKEDTRSRRSTKEDELRLCDIFVVLQGATPICEGSYRLTSLERQEVWNDCRSCKMRVGLNGNLLWETSVLLGNSKEEYELHVKMIVESLKEEKMYVKFFQQRGSREKRKLSRSRIWKHAWKREKVIACTSRQLKVLMKDCMANVFDLSRHIEAKYHLGKANVDVVPWSRKKE